MLLFITLVSTLSWAGAKPSLDEVLDVYMRSSMIMTFGGVKPFTEENDRSAELRGKYPELKDGDLISILEEAINHGELSGLGLFAIKHEIWPGDVDSKVHLSIYHQGALERLIQDPEAFDALYDAGADVPDSVDKWVSNYLKAVKAGGYKYDGPRWANIFIGVSLGYPPRDVVVYSDRRFDEKASRKIIKPETGNVRITGYARMTDKSLYRDQIYLKSASKLVSNYTRLKNKGLLATEILKSNALGDGLKQIFNLACSQWLQAK